MVVLAICNHKGGTGKTTSTIHMAAALGLSGHRTLVIDLDPQGFLSRMMGIDEPERSQSSLMLFDHEVSFDQVRRHPVKGFDVIPATTALTKYQRQLNKPTDVLWAKEAMAGVDLPYDFVLFDTAAAVTVYSLNALVASQFVIIPVTPEYQPVVGAEQTHQTTQLVRKRLNPRLSPPLFLFTQVDARKRTHHHYRSYLREKYGDLVMDSIIRTSAALSSSKKDGTTVFDRSPHARGAHDYANATDELLQHVKARTSASDRASDDAISPPGGDSAPDLSSGSEVSSS